MFFKSCGQIINQSREREWEAKRQEKDFRETEEAARLIYKFQFRIQLKTAHQWQYQLYNTLHAQLSLKAPVQIRRRDKRHARLYLEAGRPQPPTGLLPGLAYAARRSAHLRGAVPPRDHEAAAAAALPRAVRAAQAGVRGSARRAAERGVQSGPHQNAAGEPPEAARAVEAARGGAEHPEQRGLQCDLDGAANPVDDAQDGARGPARPGACDDDGEAGAEQGGVSSGGTCGEVLHGGYDEEAGKEGAGDRARGGGGAGRADAEGGAPREQERDNLRAVRRRRRGGPSRGRGGRAAGGAGAAEGEPGIRGRERGGVLRVQGAEAEARARGVRVRGADQFFFNYLIADMHLYSLTLQKSTSIHKALYGSFSTPKAQEIVVSKVKHIELLKINENTGKLQTIASQEVFGIIRAIESFRFPGNDRDNLVIGSDSGRVVVLGFDAEKNVFVKVHQETYGKTGCRRIVPGQYLACDPKGRAFMISAVEKNKFVYIINRENEKITISSPLEAPKSHTIVYDIVGLDAGYDNAQFAAIESDYGDWQDKDSAVCTGIQTKFLTIYEMDFGLNTVRRKTSEPVHLSSHSLLMVPSAPDGPGGVIVLCEDFLHYKGSKNHELKVAYPKRLGMPPDRGAMISCKGFFKNKATFFYLLQTEYGDLFELNLNFTKDEVHHITLKYFDTIPRANSLCIMKSRYLFAPCDMGNHNLYRYVTPRKDEPNPIITSTADEQIYFTPRKLLNLYHEEEVNNFSCISDLKVADMCKEGNSQIYVLCAAGNRSTLRVLRHGLAVNELGRTPLSAKPLGVWTLKGRFDDQYQKYIVLAFLNQTLVLEIGESVKEFYDSGMDASKQTVFVATLEDSSIVQVHTSGFHHIRANKPPENFQTDSKMRVTKAVANQRQLALVLAGGELFYFELDATGSLKKITNDQMDHEVNAIEIPPIERGRQRAPFLCVGLSDQTVRLLSLDPENLFERGGQQSLPSQAESLCLMEMTQSDASDATHSLTTTLFLFIGLSNGILIRTSVDPLSGNLTDNRARYLGNKAVKCFRLVANSAPAMLAVSSRSWLCYNNCGRIFMQPLSYDTLDHAAAFISQNCQGLVATNANSLRIIMPEKFGELFNQQSMQLEYSPRRLICHEPTKTLFIIESENRAYSLQAKQQKIQEVYDKNELPDQTQYGSIQDVQYRWASLLRVVDPLTLDTLGQFEFLDNQHACSLCTIQFAGYLEQCVCVGTVKDLKNEPTRSFTQGFIHTFTYDQKQLKLKHSTPIDEVPYAIAAWNGRLLVGAGSNLRVYELGNQRVLKKAELKSLNSNITNIMVKDDRIYVAESSDSLHLLRYKIKEQTFMELADDILPRYVTASTVLDYHTVVAGDKFENIFVSRVPLDIDEEQEEHPYEYKMKMDQGCMNGAPFKMDQICNFYVGEVVTSVQKASLVATSSEVVVYGTTMGSIGALYPFDNREDIDFYLHLEMYLRVENPPLSGRDHMMFRSAYGPCKAVVDGDLCEQYGNIGLAKQKYISEQFDRTPADIIKKLEDVRNKIL